MPHPPNQPIHTLPSTHGISSNYILFNAIFNTSQLSHALFLHAYGWPQEGRNAVLQAIAESRLKGIAAYGGVLGLLQIFVQWSCSIRLQVSSTPLSHRSAIANDDVKGHCLFPRLDVRPTERHAHRDFGLPSRSYRALPSSRHRTAQTVASFMGDRCTNGADNHD
jgi:hypothetical protein